MNWRCQYCKADTVPCLISSGPNPLVQCPKCSYIFATRIRPEALVTYYVESVITRRKTSTFAVAETLAKDKQQGPVTD